MNAIAATSRAFGPEEEWALLGARRLLAESFHAPLHWSLFDRAAIPSSLRWARGRAGATAPNSFFHQTLAPFSLVLVTGAGEWSGPSLELLYALLAKSRVPLLAMGLSVPAENRALTRTEALGLKRYTSLVVARDLDTKNYFKQYGLEPPVLPCPSLFAATQTSPEPQKKRVAFCLSPSRGEERFRSMCRQMETLREEFDVSILCPTVETFMRTAPMFGDRARYSYHADDYLSWFGEADVVVTDSIVAATAANSCARPALSLHPPSDLTERERLPFVFPVTEETLSAQIAETLSKPHAKSIEAWRHGVHADWLRALPHTDSWAREAA